MCALLARRAAEHARDARAARAQRVHASLGEGPEADGVGRAWAGPSDEDPAYRLLVDCNQLAVRNPNPNCC